LHSWKKKNFQLLRIGDVAECQKLYKFANHKQLTNKNMNYLSEAVNALNIYITPKEVVKIVEKERSKKK